MTDIIEKLEDLLKQATTERSHHYVASCCREAIAEIMELRGRPTRDAYDAACRSRSGKRYFLDRDDDGHWYVILVDAKEVWESWLRTSYHLDMPEPDFARRIGGSHTLLSFMNPTIE